MSTTISCPKCSAKLRLSEKHLGHVIRCPSCSAKLKVPGKKSPPGSSPAASRPAPSPAAAAPAPPSDELADDDFLDDEFIDDVEDAEDEWGGVASDDGNWGGFQEELESYGSSPASSSGEDELPAPPVAAAAVTGGIPIRTSVMDHESWEDPSQKRSVPGMGVLTGFLEFMTSGKGILLGVMVVVLAGVGLPLMHLYRTWMKDAGYTDGDEQQQQRTAVNVLNVVRGGKRLAEAESLEEAKAVIQNAKTEIGENNAKYNAAQGRNDAAKQVADAANAQAVQDAAKAAPAKPKLERPAELVLAAPPAEKATATEVYVVRFDAALQDVEYHIAPAADTTDPVWLKAATELPVPAGASALPLNAAVNSTQRLLFVSEQVREQLQKNTTPFPIRIGHEQMQVTGFDEFTDAVRVARIPAERFWHSVSEPVVILPADVAEELPLTSGPLFEDEKVFCWRPMVDQVGSYRLRLRWREKLNPHRGELNTVVMVRSKEAALAELREQIAAQLAAVPAPWQPVPAPPQSRERSYSALKVGRDTRQLLAQTGKSRARSKLPLVAVTASGTPDQLTTNVLDDDIPVELEYGNGTGFPLLELPASSVVNLFRENPPQNIGDVHQSAKAVDEHSAQYTVRRVGRWKLPGTGEEPEAIPGQRARALHTSVRQSFELNDGQQLLIAVGPRQLWLLNTADWKVIGGFTSDRRIQDVAVTQEGPVVLLQPDSAVPWFGGISPQAYVPIGADDETQA
ncbi:MAG: zf-TFIIB domain-containing protein, partial [Planctomycetaceae bacterium]|nr:zf-TFIIB domain-containing protein [Planctomycetaceae bacterium]